jgi:hypothetical protein
MKGLVEESQEHLQEHEKGEVLDQVLVAGAQKVEHYEIAAYGTARAMAKSLGLKEAMNLLQETLREEEQMDKGLTAIALRLQRGMGKVPSGMESMSNGRGSRSAGRSAGSSSRAGNRSGGTKKKAAAGSRSASARGGQTTERRTASKRAPGRTSARNASAGNRTLTDHDEIRQWAEERGAHPSCVRGTGNKGDIGMLRLDFPGYTGADKLQEISWDDFFEKFDEQGLSLLVQDKTARGQKSNFNKLVSRETAAASKSGGRSRSAGGR